jgi:nitrate/nitrite transporter NarK
MGFEWILRIVLIGIAHWILAVIVLNDLAHRQKVFGGRKWIWATIILVIMPCLGSLIYLMFHPQIMTQRGSPNEQDHHRDDWPRY